MENNMNNCTVIDINDIEFRILNKSVENEIYKNAYRDRFGTDFYSDTTIKAFTIQLTDRCNLCCSYCFQINKGVKVLKFETAKKLIDYLLTCKPETDPYINSSNNGILLDFVGGEPFLEVDLMDQICEYFEKQLYLLDHPWKDNYRFGAATNGTLYFTSKVQSFINKYKEHLKLTFSVDGNKELHDSCRVFPDGSGSYDMAVKATLYHREHYDHDSNTKLTISPDNVSCIYDAVVNLIKLGFTIIHMRPVYEEGWKTKHAQIYYQELKKLANYIIDNKLYTTIKLNQFTEGLYSEAKSELNWCGCGNDMQLFAMDTEGNIFNCIRFAESSLPDDVEPLIIGNVDDGIGATEDHKHNINCMGCTNRRNVSDDKCYYCPISNTCGWCIAYSHYKCGTTMKRTTYSCQLYMAESLANTYYLSKLAERICEKDESGLMLFYRPELRCPYDWAINIISKEEYDMLIKISHSDRRRLFA